MNEMKQQSGLSFSSEFVRARLTSGAPIPSEREVVDEAVLTPAAVLVPIVQRPDGLYVMLTRRTSHLNHHPGQISFPGGRLEAGDTGASDAALRETEEETGIPRSAVELIGSLPDYPTVTGFLISSVVGLLQPPLVLMPDRFEVEEIFEVPLSFLADARNHQRHEAVFKGQTRHYWAMPWGDYYIWGATAGILRMLSFALAEGDERLR
jgi:8-oxo-dGTP pyrophosphatase MutT (NUDIX family)